MPGAWALTKIQCSDTDSSGSTTTGKATFKVAAGENVTCTYTNSRLPTLTVKKHVINDNGGSAVAGNWDIHVKSGTLDVTGSPKAGSETGTTYTLAPGTYKASETGGPTGGGYSFDGFSYACDSSGSVTLNYGDNKVCKLTNNDNPATIIIQKNAKPQNGTFSFSTTGSTAGPGTAWPGNPGSFTLTGSTADNGNVRSFTVDAGNYTVPEGTQLSWVMTGIGGSTDPQTPYNCTVTGPNGKSTGVGDLDTKTVQISIKNGDTVTCVFENTGNGATRTQGFWATHPQLADLAWNGGTEFGHTFPGVTQVLGDKTLCGKTLTIDAIVPTGTGNSELMGAFWADVSKTSTAKKRSALSQAKMQLLQQLVAAELNASAFGSTPSTGSISAWEAAFCGTDLNAVKTAQQQAASFNSKGDSAAFTPGTSADSKFARKIANIPFWDYLN